MIVQIYAIKTLEEARICLDAGVDHPGVVVSEQGSTPDSVSINQARLIFAVLPAHCPRLALTGETEPDVIVEMVHALNPHILHLSGDITALPPAGVRELRARLPGVRIMQAIPVTGPEAIDLALAYEDVADFLLLDSKHPDVNAIGATGQTHDWSISAQIVRAVSIPVILAGGLSPENVVQAIRTVRPWGVDSNTHTNIPGSWAKDANRVHRFVQAARSAL